MMINKQADKTKETAFTWNKLVRKTIHDVHCILSVLAFAFNQNKVKVKTIIENHNSKSDLEMRREKFFQFNPQAETNHRRHTAMLNSGSESYPKN